MIRTPPLIAAAVVLALCSACKDAPASEVSATAQAETEGTETQATEAPAAATPSEPLAGAETVSQSAHFGAPFSLESDPLRLDEAIETCANTGQPCKVEGTIEAVCQNRGCWFSLVAPQVPTTVRIRMQDYAFFVPMDSMGQRCVFEGTLQRETISQEMAQHYADEEAAEGETVRQVDGPEDTYQFLITGVEIFD